MKGTRLTNEEKAREDARVVTYTFYATKRTKRAARPYAKTKTVLREGCGAWGDVQTLSDRYANAQNAPVLIVAVPIAFGWSKAHATEVLTIPTLWMTADSSAGSPMFLDPVNGTVIISRA